MAKKKSASCLKIKRCVSKVKGVTNAYAVCTAAINKKKKRKKK